MKNKKPKLFLTARWENLIIASYKIDTSLLEPHLPKGLELDTIDGNAFVSLVAFNFNDTKVRGISVPFHVNFPEINLRFYVKGSGKRGVVFVRELVPRCFIALTANALFNENYHSLSMSCNLKAGEEDIICSHEIILRGARYEIKVEAHNKPFMPGVDSTEHFFKEHEWGFGKTRKGDTMVYRVEHSFWEVFPVVNFDNNFDFAKVYGKKWLQLNYVKPYNIAFAKGSAVRVFSAEKL